MFAATLLICSDMQVLQADPAVLSRHSEMDQSLLSLPAIKQSYMPASEDAQIEDASNLNPANTTSSVCSSDCNSWQEELAAAVDTDHACGRVVPI